MRYRILTYGLVIAVFVAFKGIVVSSGEDRSTIPKIVKDVLKDSGINKSSSSFQRKYDSRKSVVGYESESSKSNKISADNATKGLRSNFGRRDTSSTTSTTPSRQRRAL